MSLSEAWKNFHRNRRIKRHYGELNPTHASVIGGSVPIRVDPLDGRARKKLLYDPIRGRDASNHHFWFTMLDQFQPTVCIDIGLNYGECLLAGRLPANAMGYGFEANTKLKPFIDETLQAHPDADRLRLCFSPVADQAGQEVTLWIDPTWSGKSTVTGQGNTDSVPLKTTTVTVDELVPRPGENDRLLFKIDIEGFEPVAFRGMQRTLQAAGRVVGFSEFGPADMKDQGVDLDQYWAFLAERFSIYSCFGIGQAVSIKTNDWAEARNTIGGKHGDLILLKGFSDKEEQQLIKQWQNEKSP